jgi:hypothetical protein
MCPGVTVRRGVLCLVATVASGCGGPGPGPAPARVPGTGEAFAEPGAASCSAVRTQTEPDLMGWDSGSRLNLNMLRQAGVVAVRYVAKGCNVELEVLPNCIGEGSYKYTPYSASDTKIARNAQELYAELPIGAARLQGKVQGGRAIRTDYSLVGMAALPPGSTYAVASLKGPDCARATHVVSRVYLGGFAMVAGESQTISGSASFFGVGAGAESQAQAERLAREGDPAQCQKALGWGEPQPLCSVPLRIGLLAIERAGTTACPTGTSWDGQRCAPGATKECPAETTYQEGKGCVAVAPVDPPPVPHSQLSGAWVGQGCQVTVSDHPCWSIRVALGAPSGAGIQGLITYATLGCEARLEFVRYEGEAVAFRERYTKPGTCVQDGWVWLTPTAGGKLRFQWAYPDGRMDSESVLTRE